MGPGGVRVAWGFAGFVVLWIVAVSEAFAIEPWTGSRTSPGSIYYHGPNQLPWNADTGRYVGWEAGATPGSAKARSVYNASIGRVPITINGSQTASAASIARAFRPFVRAMGPVGVAASIAGMVWDAATGTWQTQAAGPGAVFSGPTGVCNGLNTIFYGADGSACVWVLSSTEAHACQGAVPMPPPWYRSNYWRQYTSGGPCAGDDLWWEQWTLPSGYTPPAASHEATDAELENALKAALENNPAQAAATASQAEANGAQVELSQPVELSGPGQVQHGTETATTVSPAGTTTTNTTTVSNVTYNQNNVYNQVTTTTTTTNPDGSTTTTTNTSGSNPPQQNPANPPVECGSLSCESTQQQVQQNTAQIQTNTKDILTELKAESAPGLPDQLSILEQAKAKDVEASDAAVLSITSAVSADTARWFQWVWTPPAGTCSAPTANLHGVVVSFDYCPFVDNIRTALGWLLSLFGSWHIYGVLFRRGSA